MLEAEQGRQWCMYIKLSVYKLENSCTRSSQCINAYTYIHVQWILAMTCWQTHTWCLYKHLCVFELSYGNCKVTMWQTRGFLDNLFL